MKHLIIIQDDRSYLSPIYGIKEILEHANTAHRETFTITIMSKERYIQEPDSKDLVVLTPLKMDKNFSMDTQVIKKLITDHKKGSIIISLCGGAFYLCAAGIPGTREVTTHWKLAPELQNIFPKIIIKEERILIDQGDYISAGGISSYQDTALYLIKQYISREAALETAKFFLISPQNRTQLQYSMMQLEVSGTDNVMARAQRFIIDHFSEDISLEDIASHCGTTTRTLLRHFTSHGSLPPGEYLRLTRFNHAKELLEKTYIPIKTICSECGFSDIPSFSRTFKKLTGLPPGEYRKRNHAID